MLIRQIKLDSLKARKARKNDGKATLLSTLFSEASMVGKNDGNRESTDVEVIQIIKKFIKGLDETISLLSDRHGKNAYEYTDEHIQAIGILRKYLPKQLSNSELKVEISKIMVEQDITDIKKMGLVMKTLKENHEGQFDGKIASKLVRELLA